MASDHQHAPDPNENAAQARQYQSAFGSAVVALGFVLTLSAGPALQAHDETLRSCASLAVTFGAMLLVVGALAIVRSLLGLPLQFTLRAILVGLTIFAIWLGWEMNAIRERNEWRQANVTRFSEQPRQPRYRGAMYSDWYTSPRQKYFPTWRTWLGDSPVTYIGFPQDATNKEVEQAISLFPEAEVVKSIPPVG